MGNRSTSAWPGDRSDRLSDRPAQRPPRRVSELHLRNTDNKPIGLTIVFVWRKILHPVSSEEASYRLVLVPVSFRNVPNELSPNLTACDQTLAEVSEGSLLIF